MSKPDIYVTRSGRRSKPPERLIYDANACLIRSNEHEDEETWCEQHLIAFKASTDPDTMYHHQAMKQPDREKFQLTCSYCSRIFKDPIDLPCGDSICREHLSDKDVLKVNRIKCKKCNEEFGVKSNPFKSNYELKKLVESHSYLNEDEISRKQKLEETVRKFCEFYDEFVLNKNKIESDVFDHFQEIRFQIDEQREELKKRI